MAKKDLSNAAGLTGLSGLFQPTRVAPAEEEDTSIKEEPVLKSKDREPKDAAVSPPPKQKKQQVRKKVDESAPKPKKEQASAANIFSVNLEAIRKTETKYTGIRLKKDLFDRLEKIATKEKVKSTNSLIAKVLEAFCDGYEGKD